jgi:hypothetical protein
MPSEIVAIFIFILVSLLIFVIDLRHWLKATGLKYVWRWLKSWELKEKAIWLVKLFLIPIVLISGVMWFIQLRDNIGAILVLALVGVLILIRLWNWEKYVRQRSPEIVQVEESVAVRPDKLLV